MYAIWHASSIILQKQSMCNSVSIFWISVRDAAARLPNGEGTRADICELLKDSQFVSENTNDSQVGLFEKVLYDWPLTKKI